MLDKDRARPVNKHALDLGIGFFDTANVYSLERSEKILGRARRDFANRDEVGDATKVHGRMREGPNGAGLSREATPGEIDNSLRWLGMLNVDLYIVRRWDYDAPIKEAKEALHDVVQAGKAQRWHRE